MRCEHCNQELSPPWFGSLEPYQSIIEGKMFCNTRCCETHYLLKIEKLTKSENAWHEAWYQLREIIGRLGCRGIKGIDERYEENRKKKWDYVK